MFDQNRRDAVPPALVESAHIPGFEGIRYWADELTPQFQKTITDLYMQIKRMAAAVPALFECGVEVGRVGRWKSEVPTTPVMVGSGAPPSPQ